MTHLAVRRPSYRGSNFTETLPEFEAGEEGETLVTMNLREEEDIRSAVLHTIGEGTHFTVVEAGANHRALISAGNLTGWISTKTDLDQPLTKKSGMKRKMSSTIYEIVTPLNLREEEDFKSAVMGHLPAGTQFTIIEGCASRAKISVDGMIGWITAKTEIGQPMIKKLGASEMKLTNPVDNYVMKVVSGRGQAAGKDQGTMMMTTPSGRVVPVASAEGVAKPSSAKEAPKLARLACCCGS